MSASDGQQRVPVMRSSPGLGVAQVFPRKFGCPLEGRQRWGCQFLWGHLFFVQLEGNPEESNNLEDFRGPKTGHLMLKRGDAHNFRGLSKFGTGSPHCEAKSARVLGQRPAVMAKGLLIWCKLRNSWVLKFLKDRVACLFFGGMLLDEFY